MTSPTRSGQRWLAEADANVIRMGTPCRADGSADTGYFKAVTVRSSRASERVVPTPLSLSLPCSAASTTAWPTWSAVFYGSRAVLSLVVERGGCAEE